MRRGESVVLIFASHLLSAYCSVIKRIEYDELNIFLPKGKAAFYINTNCTRAFPGAFIKKMNQPIIQEPGGGACGGNGQIERYVPPEPFCVVFIKRSFPILSSQFERVGVTNWTLNLSSFVGRGYAEIKECALCVNGANGTNSFFYYSIIIPE